MTLWQQSEPTTPNLLFPRILSLYFVHFAQYKREGTYREILKGSVDFQFQDTFSMLLPLMFALKSLLFDGAACCCQLGWDTSVKP